MDLRTIVDLVIAGTVPLAGLAGLAGYRVGRHGRSKPAPVGCPAREITHQPAPLPGISIGSLVFSAAPDHIAGGDIVDVFALDSRLALLLVADVCGRGAAAAAQTDFIKYTIRTLALEGDGDPAVVLAKFNAIYARSVRDDEAFVVLILGIIDSQTGELRYASAGHDPAFIRRRDGGVSWLAPTGPIIGAAPFSAYSSQAITLGAGDVLVWTTDGMTESRDAQRRLLGTEGLAGWISAAPLGARAVADALGTALLQRCGGAARDDVAVLAVAYDTVRPPYPLPAVAPSGFDELLGELRKRTF